MLYPPITAGLSTKSGSRVGGAALRHAHVAAGGHGGRDDAGRRTGRAAVVGGGLPADRHLRRRRHGRLVGLLDAAAARPPAHRRPAERLRPHHLSLFQVDLCFSFFSVLEPTVFSFTNGYAAGEREVSLELDFFVKISPGT